MIRPRLTAAVVTVWIFAASFFLPAAVDPFSGVWKLNLSRSKLPPPLPQSQTVRIEADASGISVREEIVGDKGERLVVTVKARFDGKDYAIDGSPFADAVAYQRVDRNTIKGTGKKAGKVVVRETAVVSRDGKTLTTTYSSTDENGKQVTSVAIFDKQPFIPQRGTHAHENRALHRVFEP